VVLRGAELGAGLRLIRPQPAPRPLRSCRAAAAGL